MVDAEFRRRASLAIIWQDLVTPVRAIHGYQRQDGKHVSEFLMKRYPQALKMSIPNLNPDGPKHDADILVL